MHVTHKSLEVSHPSPQAFYSLSVDLLILRIHKVSFVLYSTMSKLLASQSAISFPFVCKHILFFIDTHMSTYQGFKSMTSAIRKEMENYLLRISLDNA
jgi:hypothetical protein